MDENNQSHQAGADGEDRQQAGIERQDQQQEGSIDRQQNQQRDHRRDDRAREDNPGLEESNRIDLDDEGRRDQQA